MHKIYPASKLFESAMSHVTDAQLDQFLSDRRRLMVDGPGGICVPKSSKCHTPFMGGEYIHRTHIPNMNKSPWPELCEGDPRAMIEPDPTAPSRWRPDGYACWDAAMAIPDSIHATTVLSSSTRSIPALRKCNTFWPQYQAMLNRVGRLSPGGPVLRYTGPWTFDLTQMGDVGWRLLEAAHVLAHLRVDAKVGKIKSEWHNASYYNQLSSILSELVVGYALDIPVDVSVHNPGMYGYPDMEYYGISVKTTTDEFEPKLRMTVSKGDAPYPDKSLIHILTTVHIEPTPFNYEGKEIRTEDYHWHDAFACKPSIVSIVGWESIDVITHQQRIDTAAHGPNYIMPAYDLMSPDTLWLYLKLCEKRWGKPVTGDYYGLPARDGKRPITSRLAYVGEWIKQDNAEYVRLLRRTPPFPCKCCYTTNYNDANAKRRPSGRMPNERKLKGNKHWQEYIKARNKILKLTLKPVVDYEAVLYDGKSRARRLRAIRNRNYNLVGQCYAYDKIIKRSQQSAYGLSSRQQAIVEGRQWVDGRAIVKAADGRHMIASHKIKVIDKVTNKPKLKDKGDALYLGKDGKPVIE